MLSEPLLSPRALNRATLQRQLLLQRSTLSIAAAVEHLVGLQHQAPNAPYFALRARLAHFNALALTTLMQQRQLVRCAMMRSTLHLVSARDALSLRPSLQAVQMRGLLASRGRDLKGLELEAVAEASEVLLCAKPLNSNELGKALAKRWPERDATSLAMAARTLHALVHVPPAGTWNSFRNAVLLPAQAWLGKPMSTNTAPDKLVLIDGRVQGTWKIARAKELAELAVEPFRKLSTTEREAVTAEANAVLDFAAADSTRPIVSFAKPP